MIVFKLIHRVGYLGANTDKPSFEVGPTYVIHKFKSTRL